MSQNNRERLRKAQAAAAKQQRMTRIIGVGAVVLLLVVVGVFVGVLLQNQGNASTAAAGAVTPPNATADGKAVIVNPGKAKDGAPVVELFFDYQCPVCKQFETAYGTSFASLADSGEIALHYRTMTFLDNNLNNDASLRAGLAATCSDVAGKYATFHNEIFVNQPATEGDGYTDTMLRETIPGTVGITGDALSNFQSCYDKQATKAFVNNSDDLGTQDMQAVNKSVATPTIHVNGKNLPVSSIAQVAQTPEALGALIKQNA